jgi:hypothetical protein
MKPSSILNNQFIRLFVQVQIILSLFAFSANKASAQAKLLKDPDVIGRFDLTKRAKACPPG